MRVDYAGERVAFLTQHGKETLVRGPLESALGCRLIHTDAYDTDQLGTFTREIERRSNAREAARKKALMAIELVGSRIGLGSEGSFVTDPYVGLLPWDVELVVWIDQANEVEVTGVAQGPAKSISDSVSSVAELDRFASRAGFPEHYLVLRPESESHPIAVKGLLNREDLIRAFESCLREAHNGRVFVEVDLRAFANPTRRALITAAAVDLSQRLKSLCPRCSSPGYWTESSKPGLPCEACGEPTRLPVAHIWRCPRCEFLDDKPVEGAGAAPSCRCDSCNP